MEQEKQEPWKTWRNDPRLQDGPWKTWRQGMQNSQSQSEPEPQKSGLIRRAVGDTAVSIGKGVIGAGEAVVGAANLITGGHAGKALEENLG